MLADAIKKAMGSSSDDDEGPMAAPGLEELCEELLECIGKKDAKGMAECLRECVHCCKGSTTVTIES